jgi:hypothetical protein
VISGSPLIKTPVHVADMRKASKENIARTPPSFISLPFFFSSVLSSFIFWSVPATESKSESRARERNPESSREKKTHRERTNSPGAKEGEEMTG